MLNVVTGQTRLSKKLHHFTLKKDTPSTTAQSNENIKAEGMLRKHYSVSYEWCRLVL